MGMVYRAHDSRLHRPVAVKLLSSELIADADRNSVFSRRRRAAARISHPAVAQIYDGGRTGRRDFHRHGVGRRQNRPQN
jgi:serine/threonine-protein kinase